MDHVEVLRHYNRSYTQRIGVLEESYLRTGRPLGASRLLFEIGPEGARVAELRRRLGLDSGYLSRLLRRLEQDRLVVVERDAADRRQRIARLSERGRRERRRLDERSQQVARALVDPLPARRREELAAALATADLLVRAATVRFDVVAPDSADARAALRSYFDELDARFGSGFDPGRTDATADTSALRAPNGTFVVMSSDAEPIGCGGIQRFDDRTAEIKRMWVHPDWRGCGLGSRLLTRLEHAARGLGRTRVVLDTNETLREAIAMYRRCGYEAIDRYNDNPYAHHWYAKELPPDTPSDAAGAPSAATDELTSSSAPARR